MWMSVLVWKVWFIRERKVSVAYLCRSTDRAGEYGEEDSGRRWALSIWVQHGMDWRTQNLVESTDVGKMLFMLLF